MSAQKNILLVEDEAMIALGEQIHLEKEGYKVTLAADGETAVDMVCTQNKPVDLILMDINLGAGIDGTQAARQILLTHDVPIVFLSSHTEKEVVEKTEQITSYGYIVKNSGTTVLFASIKMAFKLHQSHMQLRESEDRYRTVVESSPNSILIQREGRIVYVNAAAVRLLHANRTHELVGLTFLEMVHPDHRSAFTVQTQQCSEHGLPSPTVEEKLITRDGKLIDVEVITTPISFDGSPCIQVILHDIADRRKAEEISHQSLARVQAMFQAVPDKMFQLDRQGVFLTYKADVNDLHAQSESTIIGKISRDISPPDVAELLDIKIRAALETGSLQTFEYQQRIPNHGIREYEARLAASGADEVTAIVRDITDRKHAEASLFESEKRYRDLFENAPLAIFQSTLDGRVISVNTQFARVFGYSSPDEFYDRIQNSADIFADPERRQEIIRLRAQNPDLSTFENLYRRKDGCTFLGRSHMRAITGANGSPVYFEGFIEDITNNKLADNSLRESENTLRAWLNAIEASAFLMDREGIILMANLAVAQRVHTTVDEMIGKCIFDLLPPETAQTRRSQLNKAIETRHPIRFEDVNSGRVLDYLIYPVFDQEGQIKQIAVLATDITERKAAEEMARQHQTQFQAMLQAVPDLIFRLDRQGVFLDYKAEISDLYAQSAATIIGKRNRDITPPEFADLIDAKIRATLETGTMQTFEYRLPIPNRGICEYEARMAVSGADEVTAIVRDITKRKQAEEEIHNLLTEKDLLIREVHHRVKNNMSAISSLLSFQAAAVSDPAAMQVLQEANHRVRSMVNIYDQLYLTGNYLQLNSREYLSALIIEIAQTWQLPGRQIDLNLQIADVHLGVNLSFPLGIFINECITNAFKYAFPGNRAGVITISLEQRQDTLLVKVADDGVGLPEETSLDNPPGFGFQLMTLLAKQVGGQLAVIRDHGTCFQLSIPVQ